MLLHKAITLFLGEHIDTTAASYKPVLVDMYRHLASAFPLGNIRLEDVETDHLVAYRQVIWKRKYSDGTRGKYIKTIKVFWNWCVRMGKISESPARVLKGVKKKLSADRTKAMTEEELKQLLAFSRFHPRLDALVRFLADTGCRRGGAAGLRIKDVDLINCTAVVTEKGDKTRPVAFGRKTAKAIQRWIEKRPGDQGDYLFSRHGDRPTPYSISQLVRRGCIAAGIRSLGTHSLRHRKGHQLADARIAVSVAASVMGHEDIDATMHYYPRDWESARKALNELALPDVDDDEIDDPEL